MYELIELSMSGTTDILQEVKVGTWPWIVGGLVTAIVGMAIFWGKQYLSQAATIKALTDQVNNLQNERLADKEQQITDLRNLIRDIGGSIKHGNGNR
jgi:integral membrane sensor domain MASE1